jgi:hypothetical protein
MSYSYNWQNDNGIYIKYSGKVNLDDFINVNRQISRDSRYSSLSYNLSDLSTAECIELNQKELEMLANFHGIPSLCNPGLRLSIIVTKASLKEQVEKYKNHMETNNWEVELFTTFESAFQWAVPSKVKLQLKF